MIDLEKISGLVEDLLSREELLKRAAAQIQKDFNLLEGMGEVVFDLDSEEQFKMVLSDILSYWSKRDPEQFMQCIYMVDLPEHIFKGFYQHQAISWDKFVDFVFRREVLKVYLRAKYAGG